MEPNTQTEQPPPAPPVVPAVLTDGPAPTPATAPSRASTGAWLSFCGATAIVLGLLLCLTVIGALPGVPLMLAGRALFNLRRALEADDPEDLKKQLGFFASAQGSFYIFLLLLAGGTAAAAVLLITLITAG